jgi:hypothetical protein
MGGGVGSTSLKDRLVLAPAGCEGQTITTPTPQGLFYLILLEERDKTQINYGTGMD